MVVLEDVFARNSEYRRYSVRQQDVQGDVAAIHEVISRRFRRYLEEREGMGELDALGDAAASPSTQETRRRKFAYPPGLVVVDGGPAPASAGQEAPDQLAIEDASVCGLA